ncbi:MAG: hypothetical protein HY744_10145 [Deltaproteobacteria bacterium]|nr:hypothetical protein [Deltaproteobacteria bacterium]
MRRTYISPRAASHLGIVGALGLLGLVGPLAGCEGGGLGDPCTPEDEYKESFAGFKLSEENIESRSFQCVSRICLVNHFQGRVSCPSGQPKPKPCGGDSDCGQEKCKQAGVIAPACDPTKNAPDGTNQEDCHGLKCNQSGKYCECNTNADCAMEGYSCVEQPDKGRMCAISVCAPAEPSKERCYVPGTDIPVAVEICGQCSADSKRDAVGGEPKAVYCSCRCGVAAGEPDDENFNFCDCPEGFRCTEIRKNVGLGDKQITGKYCVRADTEWNDGDEIKCGRLQGHYASQCKGSPP